MTRAERRVASPRVVNIADLRRLAERRLPRAVFDYIDGGAQDEITLRENRRAFEEVTFRPRNAVAVSGCDLRTEILGSQLAMPFLLAPVGFSRLIYPQGEVCGAEQPRKRALDYSDHHLGLPAGRRVCGLHRMPVVSTLSRRRTGSG